MLPDIDGRVAWIFEDENYDIDNILGPAFITVTDPDRLKAACMASDDPDFKDEVRVGDVVVGNRNFGYGHTHFTPFIAMRLLGVKAVLAESFYPDFYRAETTNGMVLLEVPGIVEATQRWDTVKVDWERGEVLVGGREHLPFDVPSQRIMDLVENGGAVGYLKTRAGRQL